MGYKYKTYASIPKRIRNGIDSRIKATVEKYGFNVFRKCAGKFISDTVQKNKLKNEIENKEKELADLRKKK